MKADARLGHLHPEGQGQLDLAPPARQVRIVSTFIKGEKTKAKLKTQRTGNGLRGSR